MIPFLAAVGGGDQVRVREDELTAVTLNNSGGLLGATHRKSGQDCKHAMSYSIIIIPASAVMTVIVTLYGPTPALVTAAMLIV